MRIFCITRIFETLNAEKISLLLQLDKWWKMQAKRAYKTKRIPVIEYTYDQSIETFIAFVDLHVFACVQSKESDATAQER